MDFCHVLIDEPFDMELPQDDLLAGLVKAEDAVPVIGTVQLCPVCAQVTVTLSVTLWESLGGER